MAHVVTCQICGQRFDRDKIQAVYHSAARYSHATCEPNGKLVPMPIAKPKAKPTVRPEDEDLKDLKDYINKLFGTYANWALIMKQIKDYHKNQNMTYSGIKKTLQYFYEINNNKVEIGNGGIGIVPYQYQKANNYFYSIWAAKQKNKDVKIEDMVAKEEVIVIKPPQRKVKKRKLFSFLDEEEVDGE